MSQREEMDYSDWTAIVIDIVVTVNAIVMIVNDDHAAAQSSPFTLF